LPLRFPLISIPTRTSPHGSSAPLLPGSNLPLFFFRPQNRTDVPFFSFEGRRSTSMAELFSFFAVSFSRKLNMRDPLFFAQSDRAGSQSLGGSRLFSPSPSGEDAIFLSFYWSVFGNNTIPFFFCHLCLEGKGLFVLPRMELPSFRISSSFPSSSFCIAISTGSPPPPSGFRLPPFFFPLAEDGEPPPDFPFLRSPLRGG